MSASANWRPSSVSCSWPSLGGDEAEQQAGVDERQQVVDLEREVVGEVGEVGASPPASRRISSSPEKPSTLAWGSITGRGSAAAAAGVPRRRRRAARSTSRPVMIP